MKMMEEKQSSNIFIKISICAPMPHYMRILLILITCCILQLHLNAQEEKSSPENGAKKAELYFEADLGIPIMLYAHNSFQRAYKDTPADIGLRGAASITYTRFRLEISYLARTFEKGELNITSYKGTSIQEATGKMILTQTETLLYWLRNDENRVSFIGGGPIQLNVKETLTLEGVSAEFEVEQTSQANGYKLVVGGEDKDEIFKTSFSYTFARVSPELGDGYNLGGYALIFSVSFSGL